MKAAIVPQHGRVEVRDIPEPSPGPCDCLVEIDACAICTGTDSDIVAGRFPWLVEPPFVLGHESTGLITRVGDRVRNLQPGQRVTRPAGILPGERREGIGSNWGGFAERGLVRDVEAAAADGVELTHGPGQSRICLPGDVDPVSGALSVNQREILSVTRNFRLGPGSRVVVLGSGYNGLLFSLYCRHFGAGRVVVVGSARRETLARSTFEADAFADYRTEPGRALVWDLLGGEPTHLVDAVGTVRSLTLARELLSSGTAFGCYGLHEYDAIGPLVEDIERGHPTLPMGADELAVTDEWHRLWKQKFFERPGICDAAMPLERIADALARLARREAVKLVLTM